MALSKLLAFLWIIAFPCITNAQFNRLTKSDKTAIEEMITDQKESENMVGLSVGIIQNGEVAYLKGFGFQDSLKNIKATENTVYRLASVSKSVTGLLSMRLVEKNLLNLDKDIRYYIPEYPEKPEGIITSEDLLSNESGIIHYSGSGDCQDAYNKTARNNYADNHKSTYDPVEALKVFKDQKICFKPGEHYQYTTWGFCLLGAVIERAAKSPFEEVLYDELVCPLDLPTLQIEFPDKLPYPNETQGYRVDGGKVSLADEGNFDFGNVSYKVPGGGLISSVVDLTLLMKGIVNREFIKDETVKLFGSRHIPDDGKPSFYGYGTSSNFRNGDTLFWHSGSQSKTATLIYYSPENKNGVAIMCNTKNVNLYPLARLIYDYLPNSSLSGPEYAASSGQSKCNPGITAEFKNKNIEISPNPSGRLVNIKMEANKGQIGIVLLDELGRRVFHKNIDYAPEQSININADSGNYQMLIIQDKTIIHRKHIVVLKQ